MPWNAPKSLKTDEVYAVTAYLLSLGGIVPDDFTMSDANIADVQKRLPNRNGITTAHAMWPGKSLGKASPPDVKATACMHDCDTEPKVASLLPDFARNNNGNLAEQQRLVGPQRGVDTTRPPGARREGPVTIAATPTAAAAPAQAAATSGAAPAIALLKKYSCTACHGMEQKLVGPGFKQVAAKYAGRGDAQDYLAGKIKNGGQGVWGPIPMPAQSLSDAELKTLAAWFASGAAPK
jgi:cytochrome c